MSELAAGITRWWVTLYTGGMAAKDRDERRFEIESDLWEHEATNGSLGVGSFVTAVEMFGRLVFGMPADVAWRYEHDVSRTADRQDLQRSGTMMQKVADYGLTGLALLLAAFVIVVGTLVLLRVNGDLSDQDRLIFGVGWVIVGVTFLAGVYMTSRSPWISAGLISIAAVGLALVVFWLFFILVPLALLMIALAVMRARRLSAGGPPAAAA